MKRIWLVMLLLLASCQYAFLDTTNGAPTRWRCGAISYNIDGGPVWFQFYTDQVMREAALHTHRQIIKTSNGNIHVIWGNPSYPNATGDTSVAPSNGPYSTATITIAPKIENVRPTAEGRIAILRHEVGHAMGLAHVQDANEVMNASAPPIEWGTGTIAGLKELGKC